MVLCTGDTPCGICWSAERKGENGFCDYEWEAEKPHGQRLFV